MAHEYFNERRVCYDGGAQFIPRCHCGRFVKADSIIIKNGLGELADKPNATCELHGRVKMIFEGFF